MRTPACRVETVLDTFSHKTHLAVLLDTGVVPGEQKPTCPSNEEEFHDLAERFRAAKDPAEAERLGDQLGRMIFGG